MLENLDYEGLTGIVITPGDPRYEEARQEYNRAIQKYPVAIVFCRDICDVRNAVRWARCNGIGMRIRTGRHNYEGYSTGNFVLVIDLSLMNKVTLENCRHTVEVQGGALNRNLLPRIAATGCPFPVGSCPSVGVPGYAMGGGWNFFCRYLGLGCDSLLEVKMVNYEGELITANECCNEDLYWACRGGGDGNYGIIVSLTFNIPQKCGRVTYFTIYRANATAEAQRAFLTTWQRWLPGLDRRMTLRPSLYNSAEAGLEIYSRGIFFGRPEEAAALLQPLIRSADMVLTTEYTSFANAAAILGSVYPPSEMFKSTGRFVSEELSEDEIERIVALLGNRPDDLELIEFGLFALGGRVSRVPSTETAYFYRNASYILGMQAVWTDPEADETGNEWVARAFDTIAPLSEGSFVNFPYDCLTDYQQAYFGGNVPRLQAVKAKYDPEDVFNFPQSIQLPAE